MSNDQLEATLRSEAFRLLLRRGEPVGEQELAAAAGLEASEAAAILRQLESAGRIRRDGSGQGAGSAGLSVVPDRHEIQLGARRFWTWCAYDILGIFGAVAAAFLDPLPKATQVKLILGSAAHAARALELFAADDRTVGADHIEKLRTFAPAAVIDVLNRYPAAPPSGGRVGELIRPFDASLT